MGADDENLHASIAHAVLCCMAGTGISSMGRRTLYLHPGMHMNFFIHGVLGFLHHQSAIMNNDFKAAYAISHKAVRYLALPCVNADIRVGDKNLAMLHLISGVIPFALSLAGEDNIPLGNVVVAINILSLCHYAHQHSREDAWFTAVTACLVYFVMPQAKQKFVYPLGLALMEYFAYRLHTH